MAGCVCGFRFLTIKAHGVVNRCYVLSEYAEFDGVYVELQVATEKLLGVLCILAAELVSSASGEI